jgi:alcohol dehydrogenase class IV
MNTEFTVATRVITGLGSLSALPAELALLGNRVVVVADRGVEEAGLLSSIVARLPAGLVVAETLIDPNPDVNEVEESAAAARAANADAVLAIGGGSALGAAKAVAIRLTNPNRIDSYEGVGRVEQLPAPTLAVPTTAGSGSEVSTVLVLHEPGRVEELVVRCPGCEPRVAILDATVLRGLPRAPLVHAALDALSHAIESPWARRSTFFTEALGEHAAQTIMDILPAVASGAEDGRNRDGDNDELLQRLLEASCAANMACGNSGLTLVHALSTAPSVPIAHGLQNGILLPHVAAFNASISSDATSSLVEQILPLYDAIGFTPAFGAGAVGATEADAMIRASKDHPFRLNNRKDSTDEDLLAVLARAGARLSGAGAS